MILGEVDLVRMYPEFKDDVQPAGIDLRCGELFHLRNSSDVGMYDNKKFLPKQVSVATGKKQIKNGVLVDGWYLAPGASYIISVDRKIKIPEGVAQLYYPRSSLLRGGVTLDTAVGDPGFNGTLSFLIRNEGEGSFFLGKGERFCQALSYEVWRGGKYDGDYQESE